MTDFFVLLLAIAGIGAFVSLRRRIDRLEAALHAAREGLILQGQAPVAEPPRAQASIRPRGDEPVIVVREPEVEPVQAAPAPDPAPAQEVHRPSPARLSVERPSFETLVGGRLPIWIGGVALILAGFFLVRYSIEQGLLGPGARTSIAALFGLALIAASEVALRLPATRDDPRIGQALAGAGIASLYGTLYMAAALYHLVAPLTAFAAVLAITLAALALSLRHGQPTAIMALIGGFAAPLVAGFDAAGLGPLLVYLGLFVAALFGLAIRRGWGWLALAASVIGLAWTQFLIAVVDGHASLSAIGGYTMLLAGGASAALPAAGIRGRLRLLPLVVGMIQLIVIAPGLDFGPLAWSFYLVLAGAALVLAWRDAAYLPAAAASLVLLLVLEALALGQPEHATTPLAAIIATLLFAGAGHALAARGRGWAALAVLGGAGPLLVAHAVAPVLLPAIGWGLLELGASITTGWIAWRRRGTADDDALVGASLATAILVAVGLAQFLPVDWLAVPLTLTLIGLAVWATRVGGARLFDLPLFALVAALIAAAPELAAMGGTLLVALAGDRLPYVALPSIGDALRMLALPVVATLVLLRDPRQFGAGRRIAAPAAAAIGLMLLYALAKQPLAIDTQARFLDWGFVERALITQACFAAAWWLARIDRLPMLMRALLILAIGRLVAFDLLLFNPALVAQWVGPLPLFNVAVLHAAAAAAWLWTLSPRREIRGAAMAATLVGVIAAVRQATHGALMVGPVGTLENGGYSAALLGLALFWLWRGIAAARHDLRLVGLALLTLVTLKVFLVDAAALDGVLRILSFLGLGVALIAIGWAYGRFLGGGRASDPA
ncbi:DUF2339 domain-containing protein [Sphingomonas sp. RS6]